MRNAALAQDCPVAPPRHASVYARTLHRACLIAGGLGALAAHLKVGEGALREWLHDEAQPPEPVFLACASTLRIWAARARSRENFLVGLTRREYRGAGVAASVYSRTLSKAAELAGGVAKLCRQLRVPSEDMQKWLDDKGTPPLNVFLRAVDLILAETAAPNGASEPPDPPAPRESAPPGDAPSTRY